jgi:tRNA pseudouridine38-40 synthase
VPRIALGVEYDGAAFSGWQSQPNLTTVQGALESALARVADHVVSCTAAGRTDAGVHALAQVVHFDTSAERPERGWRLGANTNLPSAVSVVWARAVPGHFHARFAAVSRAYRYVILNRGSRPALAARRATWVHQPLDVERMQAAAQSLLGEHDFSAFRAIECQAKSPVRRVTRLDVVRAGEWLVLDVVANAFLHHMVRNIAGLLIHIGCGDWPVEQAASVLAGRDRRLNAPTAPPDGLYLARVDYPAEFGLPETPIPPPHAFGG